jgi:hypothetical protein
MVDYFLLACQPEESNDEEENEDEDDTGDSDN